MNSNSHPLTEREIVRSLLEQLKPYFIIKPVVFYIDLVLTGVLAWGSLFCLQIDSISIFAKLIFTLVSYSAFYRGILFIHEAVHFNKRVPGLRSLYNLIFGYACRIPFFTHDPHRSHHLPNTFGTQEDPEYAYFKGTGLKTLLSPFAAGFLSPFLLIFRFGILPLFSWAFSEKFKLVLYQRASTIVVNPTYVRPTPSDEDLKQVRTEELMCSLYFSIEVLLVYFNIIKLETAFVWLVLMSVGAFVNIWRARIAHLYDNSGDVLSPLAQLRDSVTVQSKFLSFLWAPAGIQYHSLHHLAPQIPYHNLQSAHEHLKQRLDKEHPYSRTVVKSPIAGIEIFYNTVINS